MTILLHKRREAILAAKRRNIRRQLEKHYGPGPHKNGTPQSVHGGSGGNAGGYDSAKMDRLKERIRQGDREAFKEFNRLSTNPNPPKPEPDDTSYRNQHQPSGDYGAHAYDLSEIVSPDIYTHPEWYFPRPSRVVMGILRRIRGKPDAKVGIYRAVPEGVSDNTINPGDWVALRPSYAREHGRSNIQRYDDNGNKIGPGYKVLTATVTAKELMWPADSLDEWGWFPDGDVEKHLGPGPHPDGSPQSVHGRKKGSTGQPPPTTPKQPQPQQQTPKQQTPTQQGEAGTVNNPIRTNDVREAAALLAEGKHVEFTQPRQVSTLISKLGEIAREMETKGDRAPNFDLCKVTVKGLNLFCVESKGLHRIEMPQFSGQALPGSRAEQYVNDQGEADVGPAFVDYLRDQGIAVQETAELASHLKASQMELVGKKVSGMMGAYRTGKLTESPIFVSSDNYVIDGHHRWATMIGVDLEDNVAGDLKMPVTRVDMPVTELLFASKLFTEQIMGIAPKVAKRFGAVRKDYLTTHNVENAPDDGQFQRAGATSGVGRSTNWTTGITVRRMDPKVSDRDLEKGKEAVAEALQVLQDSGFELPADYRRGTSTDMKIGVASQGAVTRQAGKNTNGYTVSRSIVISNRWKANPSGLARNMAETVIHEIGHVVLGDGTATDKLEAPSSYGRRNGELWAESFLAFVTNRPLSEAVKTELLWKLEQEDAIAKHYGPGPHKDGTPQSVHGNWAHGLSARQRVGELRTQASSGQDVGFSIHYPTGVRPRHGWMVALKGHEGRFKMSKLTKRNVRRYVRENIGVLKLKSTSFGAWLDGDDITFDVSMNIPDEKTATQIGNENGQDAIWNLDTGKEKRLKVAA